MKTYRNTQTKQLNFLLILLAGLVLMLAAAMPAFAGQEKSPVCHMTDTYNFGHGDVPVGHVITIADPALDSHMEHGDTQSYIETTLPDGTAVCLSETDYCFTNGANSFKLDGSLGLVQNLKRSYFSVDCSEPALQAYGLSTVIEAPDFTTAESMCLSFGPIEPVDPYLLADQGYNTPDNWWHCSEGDI